MSNTGTHHSFNGRRLETLGNRPQDHRQRDLLLGSMLRDHRVPMFRRQGNDPPDWMTPIPETIPRKLHRQATLLTNLSSTHLHFLRKLRSSLEACGEHAPSESLLDRLASCVPTGGVFSPRNVRDPFHPCGYGWHCPWCHSRQINDLYDSIGPSLANHENHVGRYLMVIRLRISSDRPGTAPEILAAQRSRAGDLEELDVKQVRAVRKHWGARLRRFARSLGMDSGLTISQVSPWVTYTQHNLRERCFLYEISIIGVLNDLSEHDVIARQEWLGMLPGTHSRTVDVGDRCVSSILCSMMPASQPNALRYLLFGTSYKFPTDRLQLAASDGWDTRYGLYGAASLQPWFLFTPKQFWTYRAAMKGTRLFDCFGEWRSRPSTSSSEELQVMPPTRTRRNALRSRQALVRVNDERRRHSDARHQELLRIALPIHAQIMRDTGKPVGSPKWRKILAENGLDASDRDARWLAKELH